MKKTKKCKTVDEAFGGTTGWINGGGIFTALSRNEPPWGDVYDPPITLDRAYHGMYSGDKLISPLVRRIAAGETLTTDEKNMLADVCWSMFGVSWEKEWATLSAQYNPIENYSMVEEMTGDTTQDTFGHTNTRTLANSHTKTGTEALSESMTGTRTDNLTDTQTLNLSHTKTGTETQTPNVTLTEQENTFGFNTVSADGEPTRKKTQTSTGTQQTTYNTTDADTGTDTTTHTGTQQNSTSGTHTTTHNTTEADSGTITDAESGSNTRRRDYHLTRSGNIGVTTSQQMLQSERELWMFNFFRDVVFPDIDSVLTIPVY